MATIFHPALYLRSRYLSTGVGYSPERVVRGGGHSVRVRRSRIVEGGGVECNL